MTLKETVEPTPVCLVILVLITSTILQNIIISSLPNATAVRTVYLDPSTGVLAGLTAASNKKPLILETSTIEADTSLEVLAAIQEALPEAEFLDAPVSGGIPPAWAGTLSFMVGGPREVFERAKGAMGTMGEFERICLLRPILYFEYYAIALRANELAFARQEGEPYSLRRAWSRAGDEADQQLHRLLQLRCAL